MANPPGIDECLRPYLGSSDTTDEHDCLAHLLNKIAKPIIQRIVQGSLSREPEYDTRGILRMDAEDATSDVLVKILPRLRIFKADPEGHAISDFRGLVAATTYRALTDRRRENNRHRANCEKKIRRLITGNESLAIWKGGQGKAVCGYLAWRDKETIATALIDEIQILVERSPSGDREKSTAEIVLSILDQAGHPIRLSDLVTAACGYLTSEVETVSMEIVDDESAGLSTVQDAGHVLEARRLLEALFEEIQKLNAAQRRSFLLNMTDSHGYSVEWFLFTGLATEEQLADLLEVSLDEFRELLDRLPMRDREIGKLLGFDSAKVTNIRKAVRDRLERRRSAFFGKTRKLTKRMVEKDDLSRL